MPRPATQPTAPTTTDAMPAVVPEASITPGNGHPLVLHVGGVKTGSSAIQRDLTWDSIRPAVGLGGIRHEYTAIARASGSAATPVGGRPIRRFSGGQPRPPIRRRATNSSILEVTLRA